MLWYLQICAESLKTLLLYVWVCCLVVFYLLIHSLFWSRKRTIFWKTVKFQPVELSKQPVVWHLVVFKNDLEKFSFVLSFVKLKQLVISIKQLVFMKTLTWNLFQSVVLENNLLFWKTICCFYNRILLRVWNCF